MPHVKRHAILQMWPIDPKSRFRNHGRALRLPCAHPPDRWIARIAMCRQSMGNPNRSSTAIEINLSVASNSQTGYGKRIESRWGTGMVGTTAIPSEYTGRMRE
jgi:hypothetical protein